MSNFLTFELMKKAEWRDRKAERHPEDPRSAEAAKLLRRLASETTTSEPAVKLSAAEGDVDHEWYDDFAGAMDGVLTDIGYRFLPQSIDDVVSEICPASLIEIGAPPLNRYTRQARSGAKRAGFFMDHTDQNIHRVVYVGLYGKLF